jgi:hypothetical protein
MRLMRIIVKIILIHRKRKEIKVMIEKSLAINRMRRWNTSI